MRNRMTTLVLVAGMFSLRLPVWVDICGNNFLSNYFRMLVLTRESAEMVYYLPPSLIVSRWIFALAGMVLFVISCRKISAA